MRFASAAPSAGWSLMPRNRRSSRFCPRWKGGAFSMSEPALAVPRSRSKRGAQVTAVDASPEMLKVAERRARDAGVHVTFARGDAHHLEFGDRSVDEVVCLRVLMHTPDWRRSLAELCRVADRRIVIDYPSRRSFAAVQSLGRRAASWFVPGVEAYRVMSPRAISAALKTSGFQVVRQHRLFVLPIAFHKKIGSERFTRAIEASLAQLGLLRLFGSPITLVAERCA